MSLYQDIRPDNFDDIVGNSVAIGALTNMLRKPAESRPHCILLKGPNGCGKTTIARILAKLFGSDTGSIIPISANNTNGIDTVREINRNAHLMGLGGGAKTYIIDESHELTNRAQQGFLDIIEDNPPHCYFIFCTTNPEAIIKGIHSRCSEYSVTLLRDKEIAEVLKRACQLKNMDVHPDILEAIGLTCGGSAREALVSLEMVADESVENAFELLVSGTIHDATVLELLKLLIMAPEVRRKKWKRIITTFDAIEANHEIVRRSILTFLYNKLKKYERIEEALDITHLLRIFSMSTFYGGKSQLGALIARACFETWKDE